MTSFPRGGAENTAPPRCFCRQKRNGFEAGKQESGKAGKRKEKTGEERENESGQDRQGDDGRKRQSTRTTTGRNGRKEGGASAARQERQSPRRTPWRTPWRARRHDLTRHPPGRTLSGAKNKKTPPQRGGVKNYLRLVHTGAVSRRGKHGASRDPAISHPRAPTGDQSALGR